MKCSENGWTKPAIAKSDEKSRSRRRCSEKVEKESRNRNKKGLRGGWGICGGSRTAARRGLSLGPIYLTPATTHRKQEMTSKPRLSRPLTRLRVPATSSNAFFHPCPTPTPRDKRRGASTIREKSHGTPFVYLGEYAVCPIFSTAITPRLRGDNFPLSNLH